MAFCLVQIRHLSSIISFPRYLTCRLHLLVFNNSVAVGIQSLITRQYHQESQVLTRLSCFSNSSPHFPEPILETMAPDSRSQAFGFVGLGNMGSQMAFNLATYAQQNSLPRVKIWNRTRSKIEYLAQESHCEIVSSLEEVADQCDIVHTCLANDEVAFSVYRQFFQATNVQGTIFVDHSTLFPTTSTALQAEALSKGAHFLSCPVFGPPAAAKSAGLLVVVSGDPSARETVKPYLVPTIGKAILDCGDDSSKGALMKILGNNCILGTIELLSESFTLAEKTGFDAGIFYDFIRTFVFLISILSPVTDEMKKSQSNGSPPPHGSTMARRSATVPSPARRASSLTAA